MRRHPIAAVGMFTVTVVAAVALASPADAMTYFSVGAASFAKGGQDTGVPTGLTPVVTFDAATAAGIVETDTGPVGIYAGHGFANGHMVAARPAGDKTAYEAVGAGGSATFDFSGYLKTHKIETVSVYWGSIDSYNTLEILNKRGGLIGSITGSQLPAANGDQGASITNRRVFISLARSDHFGALRFLSSGVAFEYDNIGAGPAVFNAPNGGVFDVTPSVLSGRGSSAVPEPAVWALMLTGLGLAGAALRRRRSPTAA